MTPKVELVAKTEFVMPPDGVDWDPDGSGGSALGELAGRGCYQSWSKPDESAATSAKYIRKIIRLGHFSVLEHPTVSFYLSGISRSLTHELIRHRHFNVSQLSQRYVPLEDDKREAVFVFPPLLRTEEFLGSELCMEVEELQGQVLDVYAKLVDWGRERGLNRKDSRQAARMVLPNASETQMTLTGNWRAWRHFIAMRAALGADEEINELAIAVLESLLALPEVAPAFEDFMISEVKTPDGRLRRVAFSELETSVNS